jgi:hypothetical protein
MNKQHDQEKVLGERVKCMHALSQKQQKDNKAGCVQLKQAVPAFADLLHKQLFNKLIEKDHTDAEDIERIVLFYFICFQETGSSMQNTDTSMILMSIV